MLLVVGLQVPIDDGLLPLASFDPAAMHVGAGHLKIALCGGDVS